MVVRPKGDKVTLFRTLLLLALLAPFVGQDVRAQQASNEFKQIIPHKTKGYAFEVPKDWELSQPDFYITGPNESSIAEVVLPIKIDSIDQASRVAGYVIVQALALQSLGDPIEISGRSWNGQTKIFKRPGAGKRKEQAIVQFIAQSGSEYRLFYMTVPMTIWSNHQDEYIQVLKSFRMPLPEK